MNQNVTTAADPLEPPELPCASKLIFDTERAANAAATVAAYQHGVQLQPYICRYCGLWHLSSISH